MMMICLPPQGTPPPTHSSRHGPQRTQHTTNTAATPRYPQGRRQNPCRRAGPTHAWTSACGASGLPEYTTVDTMDGNMSYISISIYTALSIYIYIYYTDTDVDIRLHTPSSAHAWTSAGGAYGLTRGCILRNSRALVVQECGQCGWGIGQKDDRFVHKEYLVNGKLSPCPPHA